MREVKNSLSTFTSEDLLMEVSNRTYNIKLVEILERGDMCSCCNSEKASEHVQSMAGNITLPMCSGCYNSGPHQCWGMPKLVYCEKHPPFSKVKDE